MIKVGTDVVIVCAFSESESLITLAPEKLSLKTWRCQNTPSAPLIDSRKKSLEAITEFPRYFFGANKQKSHIASKVARQDGPWLRLAPPRPSRAALSCTSLQGRTRLLKKNYCKICTEQTNKQTDRRNS